MGREKKEETGWGAGPWAVTGRSRGETGGLRGRKQGETVLGDRFDLHFPKGRRN